MDARAHQLVTTRCEWRRSDFFRQQHSTKNIRLFPIAIVILLGALSGCKHSAHDQLSACRSELKNLGTAMEMYSTDWSGNYPSELSRLTLNYLKTLPSCPVSGTAYEFQVGPDSVYNDGHYKDYYFFRCVGESHTNAGLQANLPAYDSNQGMMIDQAALDSQKKEHEAAPETKGQKSS